MSSCLTCDDTGRTDAGGISRHCSCPLGRTMAGAHWSEKANEETTA